MNNLIRIQGKVVKVESAKTGHYVVIQEQETGNKQGAFSQWKPQERVYSFTLRKNGKYFFVVSWQKNEQENEPQKDNIYQPYEDKDTQNDRQTIRELEARLKQAEATAQQWKNAYYNQKWMLKKAQQNTQQRTVENKIKALESKPGKKSKQDLDYLKLLTEFNGECKENWAWLNTD